MDTRDMQDLFNRYENNEATPEERALLETWYLQYKEEHPGLSNDELRQRESENLQKILQFIHPVKKRAMWPKIAIAASILIFFSAGITAYVFTQKQKVVKEGLTGLHHILPGSNKATIMLSDGKVVDVEKINTGLLASEGSVQIHKTKDGEIRYDGPAGINNSSMVDHAFNTAITPIGGQYEFILSDQTRVWLNASSSIKFPVEFKGSERKVEITGEVYFEVAHNQKMPFRVVTSGQTIEVLGTHFNVNAYDDERDIKTTLLEGSVRISAGKMVRVIRPGEQARYRSGIIESQVVDVDEVVAWKNGYFSFQNADLVAVMRQISRWYNVEVKYVGENKNRKFSGTISRNSDLSQILEILEFKKIHTQLHGNVITIQR